MIPSRITSGAKPDLRPVVCARRERDLAFAREIPMLRGQIASDFGDGFNA